MNTIISKYEYEDLLKKHVKRNFYCGALAMFSIGMLQLIIMIAVVIFTPEPISQKELWIMFIIPVVFLIVSVILLLVAKRVDQREIVHYSFPVYDEYEADGTKVPLYRMIQNGKNSETIYTLLILNDNDIHIFDIKRKGLKDYLAAKKSQTIFQFYVKYKNDEAIINKKIEMIINGKKRRFYGFKEVNQKLLLFCQSESYHVEIIKK